MNAVDEWGGLMLEWGRILKQDRLLRAMTGLNRKGFEALLPSFAIAYSESLAESKPSRQRAVGSGRKATLRTLEAKLFYSLFYCKCYPTFDLASVLFGARPFLCSWVDTSVTTDTQRLL